MKTTTARIMTILFALLMALTLAACTPQAPAASATPAPTKAPVETATPEPEPVGDPAFQKYDPPITVTAIRTLDDTTKFIAGQDINNNDWAKLYEEELGIILKYDWTASTGQQYDDKLNVNIASGMIPDILGVNKTQLARLAKTDLINKDLGPVYEKFASPLLKELITQEGTTALDSATFDGGLVAMPNTGSSMDGAPMMWIRRDWMETVGKSAPKTIDDLVALIEDFTTKDPDGNGGPYYGLAMQKDLYGGFAGIDGFCNAYGAYPQIWVKDGSGKLVYGSYQPEMKTALKKLQDLYAAGKIDKEFAVKDGGKESELCVSGKIGIQFGAMWNPLWPLQATRDNNPKADWIAYAIPSATGSPGKPQISLGTSSYYVCKKDFQNPEVLVKLQNMFVQKGWGGTVEDYVTYFNNTVDGTLYETFKYSLAQAWPARKNLDIHYAVVDAFARNDTSKLNPEQLTNYTTAKSFKEGDDKGWGMARVFAEDGSFRIMDEYVKGDLFIMNAFFGADTATMTTKMSAISKLEIETFTKIIMGDPIDNFDAFVTNAMALGGDAIQKEVNDWYAATGK